MAPPQETSGHADKNQALQHSGSRNPRPQDVQDELFRTNTFFDPRDMVQVKYEMLRRVHNEGLPVAQAAALFGLSRPTFYHARQVFQAGGLPGLIRQRPGPKRASKLSEDVMHYLELLLADGAKPSAAALAEQVRQHFGLVVHPRSIERALQRRQKKGR